MSNEEMEKNAQAAAEVSEAVEMAAEEPMLDVDTVLNAQSEEVAQLAEQVAALKDQVIRERAENENLRKRQERELLNAHKFANERIVKELLPVLDSLVLGLKAAQESADKPEAMAQFIEGSELTLKMLRENLAKHGVEEVNPASGDKFNPDVHEAVAMLPNPELENNTVMHVAQIGYVLNGRTVRAAQVVIVKNS